MNKWILLLALGMTHTALAAPCKARDPIGQALCKNEEAVAAFKAQNYELAAEKWMEAFKLASQRPQYLANYAFVMMKLKRWTEAANAYEEYRKHKYADPKQLPNVMKQLEQLDKRLVVLEVYAAGQGLVSIDGTVVGRAPVSPQLFRVVPDVTHSVAVKRPDLDTPQIKRVKGKRGDRIPVTFDVPKPVVDCEKPEFADHPKCKKEVPLVNCEDPGNLGKEACKGFCDRSENSGKKVCIMEAPDCEDPANANDPKCQEVPVVVDCKKEEFADHPDCEVPVTGPSALGVFYRSDFSTVPFGHVGALGISYSLDSGLIFYGNGLYSRFSDTGDNKFGAEIGAKYAFGKSRIKPLILVGAPLFFFKGEMSPNIRGAVGADFRISGPIHAIAEAGVAYAITVPDEMVGTNNISNIAYLVSIGLEVRL